MSDPKPRPKISPARLAIWGIILVVGLYWIISGLTGISVGGA